MKGDKIMANDLNRPRGERPQNSRGTATTRIVNSAIKTGKNVARRADRAIEKPTMKMAQRAESIAKAFDKNIFEGLSAEEHRQALIQACINTNDIFDAQLDDPPEKEHEQMQDYMFYSQLYFMATAQMLSPDNNGRMMPGIIGGLSVLAGAALVSPEFRQNFKQHTEAAMLKYVEPFKDSAPKVWQQLSARVQSHPGCACPESVALKLLRYQKQAADKVQSGALTEERANELLLTRVSELKASAAAIGMDWNEALKKHQSLSKQMTDFDNTYEKFGRSQIKHDMDAKCEGWSEKTGIDGSPWSDSSDYVAPIDAKTVAKRLFAYQTQLSEICEYVGAGKAQELPHEYEEFRGMTSESQCMAEMLKRANGLRAFVNDSLGEDVWTQAVSELNALNEAEYDKAHKEKEQYYPFIADKDRHRFLENGEPNPTFGKIDMDKYNAAKDKYRAALREQERTGKAVDGIDELRVPNINLVEKTVTGKDGRPQKIQVISELAEADDNVREHNKRMYYELPLDATSAGRCLKKYQQEAYGSVRGWHDSVHKYDGADSINSTEAYDLANEMCRMTKAASEMFGFGWQDTIKAYRKDVYDSVKAHPTKESIWSEMVDDSIIANIPTNAVSYQTINGETVKKVVPLSRAQALAAWDGVLYNTDGSRVDDNVMMRVRNPYTKDEATQAMLGLYQDNFKLQLQLTALQEEHGSHDANGKFTEFEDPAHRRQAEAIQDEIKNIDARREKLVDAFISDNFSEELIEEIKKQAVKWFDDAQEQMRGEAKTKGGELHGIDKGKESEVKLDESLAPNVSDEDEPAAGYAGLPDKSSPSL